MSDASGTIETPILIVGGGSVGLALACDLAGRGVPCLVVEQNERPADHPRATAINARSMEFMRRWGVAMRYGGQLRPRTSPTPRSTARASTASRLPASSGRIMAAANPP
jgi:2-polyprenyl-6-methoxyphenol hydroxylase-like FAD-dependent oxidoreductase